MSLRPLSRLVVDASAIGEYLARTPVGLQVESIIEAPESETNVPALCDLEICQALRRFVHAADISAEGAVTLLGAYMRMPLRRHGHLALLPRVLELREDFSPYDAAYVALCERLDATLVTCDARLTRAAERLLDLNVIGVAGA